MRNLTANFLPVMVTSLILLIAASGFHLKSTAHGSQHQAADPREVISDSELEAFTKAYAKIQEIRLAYESRLAEVQDRQKAQQLQQQAQMEMFTAVEEQGLTVDRYNEIFAVISKNAAVREKFNKLFEDIAKKP